jgi:hypothetical protein
VVKSIAAAALVLRYFIAAGAPDTGFRSADRELAEWAFDAWARNADGAIRFESAPEASATIRLYWTSATGSLYGETRPIVVGGQRGSAVYVMADTEALGKDVGGRARTDPLWRDAIVYLTCLHELGHALGLRHTSSERDIMYFFGYGGDIVEYFSRYRRQLHERNDIRSVSGLSNADLSRLKSARGGV